MNQMKNTLVKQISKGERLVYQTVSSDAVTLRCREYPTAYSILVLRVEDDAVTESKVLYDVSRDLRICLNVMEKLADRGVSPMCAVDVAETVM